MLIIRLLVCSTVLPPLCTPQTTLAFATDFGIISLLFLEILLLQAAELGHPALASHPMASHCIPSQGRLLGTELHTTTFGPPRRGYKGARCSADYLISSLDEGPLKQRKCHPALEPTLLHMSQH